MEALFFVRSFFDKLEKSSCILFLDVIDYSLPLRTATKYEKR